MNTQFHCMTQKIGSYQLKMHTSLLVSLDAEQPCHQEKVKNLKLVIEDGLLKMAYKEVVE